MTDIFEKLAAPFPPERVSWRVGSTNKKNWSEGKPRRGQPLCYIDARDVMERLDAVLTPLGWQCEYVPVPNGTTCCRIGSYDSFNKQWVWKSNGAGATDMEGDKGAYSDAFKRAAVLWGVGRYLYDVGAPWIELDDYWRIPKEAMGQLSRLLSGEKEQSARAAHKSGDFTRIIGLLREAAKAGSPIAVARVWKAEQPAIKTMRPDWRRDLTAEKDRLKEELEAVA